MIKQSRKKSAWHEVRAGLRGWGGWKKEMHRGYREVTIMKINIFEGLHKNGRLL
jgi:hypothetical protein